MKLRYITVEFYNYLLSVVEYVSRDHGMFDVKKVKSQLRHRFYEVNIKADEEREAAAKRAEEEGDDTSIPDVPDQAAADTDSETSELHIDEEGEGEEGEPAADAGEPSPKRAKK